MTATYGRKFGGYWLSSDPPDSWVRTLLGTSIWGSMTCYLTWKKSVTPAGRLLFRLVPQAPRTAGIGSGLWGTPTSRDHKDTSNMENVPVNGLLGRQVLQEPRLWPTPNVAGGGNNCELTPHKGHYLRPSGEKAHLGLDQAARMWPTPRAEFDSGRHRGGPDTLHSAVKLFPTPHSNASTGAGSQGRDGGENLQTAVAQPGLKLNSAWVSRMMGYPDNWLTLDGEAIP